MSTNDKPPLEAALDSLRKEEERLAAELRGLESRKSEVESEIEELQELMEAIEKRIKASERPTLTLAPNPFEEESYEGLPISEAVAKLISVKGRSLRVPEIADELLARGFKTNSSNFKNLIGVTVRRLEGKRFTRQGGRWSLAA